MVLFKHRFPSGNIFIWLGKGDIWGKGLKKAGIDNVLILAGGDVLFLKTAKVLPLYEEKIKEDIKTLTHEDFIKKYDLPADSDLWKDLKEGVESGEYPPFQKAIKERKR